ncbi:Hypothetical_protein [Hexamita inflata]|uniref:Hypothetical_protein n=1 Tax=Hexamita inflata TaxID=28002 RepID=A0AA86TF63_9EUKA|nr:Hypothetical protein HINF_LOCUS3331 [Hexamita inflata]
MKIFGSIWLYVNIYQTIIIKFDNVYCISFNTLVLIVAKCNGIVNILYVWIILASFQFQCSIFFFHLRNNICNPSKPSPVSTAQNTHKSLPSSQCRSQTKLFYQFHEPFYGQRQLLSGCSFVKDCTLKSSQWTAATTIVPQLIVPFLNIININLRLLRQ